MNSNKGFFCFMKALFVGLLMFGSISFNLAQSEVEKVLGTRLVFPRIGDGVMGGILVRSHIQLTPLDRVIAPEITVRFFGMNGNEVQPATDTGDAQLISNPPLFLKSSGSGFQMSTSGLSFPSLTGWAMVDSNIPIGGYIKFGYRDNNRDTYSTVPSSPLLLHHTIQIGERRVRPPEHVVSGRERVGVALANPNAVPVSLELVLRDSRDDSVVGTHSLQIPKMGAVAGFAYEWFPALESAEEFFGYIEARSSEVFAAMSLGLVIRDNGSFDFFNAPPLPRVAPKVSGSTPSFYRDLAFQAVYFVPADVPVDPNYRAGISFAVENALDFYDIQFAGYGQPLFSHYVRPYGNSVNKVAVDLVRGKHPSEFYEAEAKAESAAGRTATSLTMQTELRAIYPSPQKLVVVHQANLNGIGFDHGGASGTATVTGPKKWTGQGFLYSFADHSNDFMRLTLSSGLPEVQGRRRDVAKVVSTLAHELGHLYGLGHRSTLQVPTNSSYFNLMGGRYKTGVDADMSIFCSALMLSIPMENLGCAIVALDRDEVETVLKRIGVVKGPVAQ